MTESGPHLNPRQEGIMSWLVFLLIVIVLAGLIGTWLAVVVTSYDDVQRELVLQHYVVIVGLPVAGVFSFIVVFLFKQTSGPVEFEAFTLKFRGAAGPVILWILCFLAIAAAIKVLW
jgi:hypothetical protein